MVRINDPVNHGRRQWVARGLCIGALVVSEASLPGCLIRDVYVNGVSVARPTDGLVLPGTAAYFNTLKAVTGYDDPLADLLNEVWVKEFNQGINEHILIEYDSSLPNREAGHYTSSSDFNLSRFADVKEKLIQILNQMEPSQSLRATAHELGHQYTDEEALPELMGYRIPATSCIHFPSFGNDTQYAPFGNAHANLLNATFLSWENREPHGIGALAALFALNQNKGSFADADRDLRHSLSPYMDLANTFVVFCVEQPDVLNVTGVYNTNPITSQTLVAVPYRTVAHYDLWNIVAEQVITANVDENASLDALTKAALHAGMSATARFPRESVNGNPPRWGAYQGNLYKDDFTRFGAIAVPSGYNNDIPKGTF